MKKIKNKDIAEMLGISTTAVSLALNDKPGVSEETKRKVFAILAEREAGQKESRNISAGKILMVMHKKHGQIIIEKPFFSDLIESVQTTALKNKYTLEVSHYNTSLNLQDYVDTLAKKDIAGIVLLATEMVEEDLKYYQRLNVPIVLLDSMFEMDPYDSVSLDNTLSIIHACEYVYRMGHRNIGYLQSSVYINNFRDRMDGFCNAIRRFGLEEYDHPVIPLHCSIEKAYSDMKMFLSNLPDGFQMPTCFLSDLDYIAVGAMRALEEAGYRIPEDISMFGFDDVSVCEVCTPKLTTIRVNRKDIGAIAVETLVKRIENPHNYYVSIQVSGELVERDSIIRIDLK